MKIKKKKAKKADKVKQVTGRRLTQKQLEGVAGGRKATKRKTTKR